MRVKHFESNIWTHLACAMFFFPTNNAWPRCFILIIILSSQIMSQRECVKRELLQAIDDHDVPKIQQTLMDYADIEQKVKLQIHARELLTRLLGGENNEQLFQQMRDIARPILNTSTTSNHESSRFVVIRGEDEEARKFAKLISESRHIPLFDTSSSLRNAIRQFWNDNEKNVEEDELRAFAIAVRVRYPKLGRIAISHLGDLKDPVGVFIGTFDDTDMNNFRDFYADIIESRDLM